VRGEPLRGASATLVLLLFNVGFLEGGDILALRDWLQDAGGTATPEGAAAKRARLVTKSKKGNYET
jgi:hypothetical protein